VPGFVNAHCHLELSHLQHTIPDGAGFAGFLKKVVESKTIGQTELAAERADILMAKNGIVAVGDISNGTSAFEVKHYSKISYHTFIETLGFSPERAGKAFEWARMCLNRAEDLGLKASIVPHAPYSVSAPLFKAVAAEAIRTGLPLSMHSQESEEEDELYLSGSGELVNHLRNNLSIDTSFFQPTGKSAMRSTLEYLPSQNNLLLVHNLFTTQHDLDFIGSVRKLNNTWFVLCPASNLFIQKRLPDIELFRRNNLQICLGTDSLASNGQLSILEEMKIIQTAFPFITLGELAAWASWNGAKALGIESWAGSFEVGKRPGINLLTGVDHTGQKLLPGTCIKKLC
ncbi:MAG TPA: amidohydrolase family protein, partial [Prolixibacteraceae bacterium]|nr:amidohydrolase family protein [Prolixibacteraceae bacterium]